MGHAPVQLQNSPFKNHLSINGKEKRGKNINIPHIYELNELLRILLIKDTFINKTFFAKIH